MNRVEDPDLFDSIVAERSRPPQRTEAALRQESDKELETQRKRALAQQQLADCTTCILNVMWREMTPKEIGKFSGVSEATVLKLLLELRDAGRVTEQGGRWERARS